MIEEQEITIEDSYFNYWKNQAMTLNDGEELCDKCEGNGVIGIFTDRPLSMNPKNMCGKCWGEGKLDWIEKVVGKPPRYSSSSSSSSQSWSSTFPPPKYGRKADARRRQKYMSKLRRKRALYRLPRSAL